MRLKNLVETVERILEDPKYGELRRFWNDFYALKEVHRVPIRITLSMEFFAKNLGIDLIDHYHKPEKYLEDSLRILRFQHEEIPDDRVLEGIVINFGEAFESSLFGSIPTFTRRTDPLLGKPIIKTADDIENLNYPDFYDSGLMPRIIETYETVTKMVKGRIPVFFERWDRSSWGTAVHLRGLTELLVDTVRNPDLVHRFLAFITEARIRWEREKENYLGTKTERALLYNDEVDAKLFPPEKYEAVVHPCEKKLADFYPKGIFYYHSCGNITPFLDAIASIRGLRRLHISPATDFKTAVQKLDRKLVFHKRMNPLDDLELCDAKTMQQRIEQVLKVAGETSLELDPGPALNVPLERIKTWINIARKTTQANLR